MNIQRKQVENQQQQQQQQENEEYGEDESRSCEEESSGDDVSEDDDVSEEDDDDNSNISKSQVMNIQQDDDSNDDSDDESGEDESSDEDTEVNKEMTSLNTVNNSQQVNSTISTKKPNQMSNQINTNSQILNSNVTNQISSILPTKSIASSLSKDASNKPTKKQRLSSVADKNSQEFFFNSNILLHKLNNNVNTSNLSSSDLDITGAIKDLNSNQTTLVISSLNTLLKCSHGGDGNPLQIEEYPEIIYALGYFLDKVNPIGKVLFRSEEFLNEKYAANLLDPTKSNQEWPSKLPKADNKTLVILSRVCDENILLIYALTIIRNLSNEISNESHLTISTKLMKHLVILLLSSTNCNKAEYSYLIQEIIINISNKLDITGRKRTSTHISWLENCTIYSEKEKNDIKNQSKEDLSILSTQQYKMICNGILSYISICLEESDDKIQIIKALEILQRLASVTENMSIISTCPDSLLDSLLEYLCVSYTAIDPIITTQINQNSTQTPSNLKYFAKYIGRTPACVGPYFTEMNDVELRDISLDTIFALCTTSISLQVRIGQIPRCVEVLVKIIESRTDKSSRTEHSATKANSILALLCTRPQNISVFQSLQSVITYGACCDDVLSDILCINAVSIFNGSNLTPINATISIDLSKE